MIPTQRVYNPSRKIRWEVGRCLNFPLLALPVHWLMLAGWAEPLEPGCRWGLTSWVCWPCPVSPHCPGCHEGHTRVPGMEHTARKMGSGIPGEADPQCQIPTDFGSMSPVAAPQAVRHLEKHERCFIPAQWLANTRALPQIPLVLQRGKIFQAAFCRNYVSLLNGNHYCPLACYLALACSTYCLSCSGFRGRSSCWEPLLCTASLSLSLLKHSCLLPPSQLFLNDLPAELPKENE